MPLVLVFTAAHAWGYHMTRPHIALSDGQLLVRLGNTRSIHTKLADVEWFQGRTSQSYYGGKTIYPSEPAVLFVLPNDTDQEYRASVGFTPESRELWTEFLEFIGLPRRTAYERRFAGKWIANVSGGLMLILGPLALGFSVRPCIELLRTLIGRGKLPELLSFQLFVPGAILLIIYVSVLWPWNGHPRGPSSRPPSEQQDRMRKNRWGLVFSCCGVIGLPMLCWRGVPIFDRLVAMTFLAIFSWTASSLIAKREATTEPIRQIDDEPASGTVKVDSL